MSFAAKEKNKQNKMTKSKTNKPLTLSYKNTTGTLCPFWSLHSLRKDMDWATVNYNYNYFLIQNLNYNYSKIYN